jgi:long-chain acyl-CoA synthetase
VGSFGCQMDSVTIVPIYDTLGMNSMEFILKQTELTTILAETKKFDMILKMKEENKLVNVKNIIYLHCNEEKEDIEETKEKLKNLGLNVISYDTIMETGKRCIEEKDNEILDKNYRRVLPDDVFLICYTSGTTDNPKGVMISPRALTLSPNFIYNVGYHLTGEDIHISFLPLAHLMEQILFTVALVFGCKVGYYSGNTNKLLEDIQELHPTYFCAVPRIYEKIYQIIIDTFNKKGALFKKLFDKALDIKLYNYEKYGKLSHSFFDPIFFNKAKKLWEVK